MSTKDVIQLTLIYAGITLVVVGIAFGIEYIHMGFKQASLERQGIQMSRWDIWMLNPKVRVMPDGRAEVITE